jgi:hypothetical protein
MVLSGPVYRGGQKNFCQTTCAATAGKHYRVRTQTNGKKPGKQLIPALLGQDYPHFDVVIVDDGSWDGTADHVREWSVRFPQLKTRAP